MKSKLQKIINQGFRGKALIAAMTLTFAELLCERGGSDEPLHRAMEVFTKLPAMARKQTMKCHAQIKAVIADVRREGFSLDAILWSTLGSITNIYRGLGFPATEIDTAMKDMIGRINEAYEFSTN
jgi:hypothetical protein